ncbi:conserved hypothetical protein [Microsporum canis CBS 113480]|uniref:Uncharacterized protein n=1 Tax=Arthroderma otae (strain ATCC MYA-4605 / CBS 113480) TaxID=554155 RepID=C5FZP9_ARTOC|nr:conserved hypothetical protein [Microsporum canis CBS 113480]EEQ35352.1 conserved hypothetical protein [Microsporum canis CBS 113480]
MAVLKNDILPAVIYNTLPNIRNVFDVPYANSVDIADLKNLLNKYNLSDRVRIKLVHIHFRLKEGEVFAAQDIHTPNHGSITIMRPLPAFQHRSLYGYHYFVDDQGNLSAYEHAMDNVSTHELEYPAKRTCIDVPYEVPLPYSKDSFDTMTEFIRDWPMNSEGFEVVGDSGVARQQPTKSHTHHVHHKHTDRHTDSHEDNDGLSDGATISDQDSLDGETMDGLYVRGGLPREIELAGDKLDQSSGLYEIVSYIVDNV